MGYRELLQALEEEVDRQIRELQGEASRQREELLEAARLELAARREQVLSEERRRLKDESARALSRARLEQERTLLGEMRRALAELHREAEAQLTTMNDAELVARLLDEIVPELGDGPVEFRVRDGHEEHLRSHLAQRHPQLLARASISGAPEVGGGLVASLAGKQLLDNTLASRLQNAWLLLEPELATSLFGDDHGGL
jgi:vacuolar-type H+-ATPase subunit E/Vma4